MSKSFSTEEAINQLWVLRRMADHFAESKGEAAPEELVYAASFGHALYWTSEQIAAVRTVTLKGLRGAHVQDRVILKVLERLAELRG